LLLHALASPFESQARLEAEIVFLRHQLNLLRARAATASMAWRSGSGLD
jgi:hypothetical protein